MADDIVVRVSVDTAEAMAATFKYSQSLEKLQLQQNRAAAAQAKLDAALASSGAGTAPAIAAQAKLDAALRRTVVAENQVAIAAARSSEIQAAASAKAAAAAEAAAVKQAAALRKVGTAAGVVGAAVALGLGVAAKSAADLNAQLAKIQTLSGATASQMQALSDAAHGFADIGISASEAADAEIELVKAGVSLKDIMGGGLRGALNLAAAGQLNVADATSIAAQAMTQFGLAGKDIPHIADLLSAGANKALGSVQDLGNALSYAGGPAHTLGVSIEDTVATLAEFAQAGLIGEKGGAALQTMFARLVKPTAAAKDVLDEYNISLYDAQGQFVGMSALAGQFQENMSGLSLETRNAALQTVFGNRAFRAAAILYEDGAAGAAEWAKKVNDAGNAARTTSGQMDSLQGDLQKLGATIQNDLIDVGQQLQPILRDITQALTTFGDIIGALPDPVKAAAVEVGAVVAALGLGFWAFTRIKAAAVGLAETLGILATAQVRVAATAGTMAAGENAAAASMARSGMASRLNMGALGKGAGGLGLLVGGSLLDQQGSAGAHIGSVALQAAGVTLMMGAGATVALPAAAAAGLFVAMKNARDTAGPGFGQSTTGNFSGGVQPGMQPRGGTGAFSGGGPPSGWIAGQQEYKTSAAQTAKVLAQLGETGQQTFSDLSTGAQHASVSFGSLAKAADKAWASTLRMNNATLTRRGDWSSYQQAIDDATQALKDNGRTLDQTTQKGRDNAASLDNMATTAAEYAATIKDPILKLDFMQDSRRQLFETAKQFGDTKAEAWEYVDSVLGIPKEARTLAAFEKNAAASDVATYAAAINAVPGFVDTVITAHAEQAIADAQRLVGLLGVIKSKDIWINVNTNFTHTGVQMQPASGGYINQGRLEKFARGGTIPHGGYVRGPGTGTSDSIPAMISNGEFVMKAAAVQRYGVGMMHAINQMRVPPPIQYARGGMAGQGWGGGSQKVVVEASLVGKRFELDVGGGRILEGIIRDGAKAVVNANQSQINRRNLAGSSQ